MIKRIPPEHLGPLEYIGGGAWLGGVPARNMSANEVDRYYFALIDNLRGPRPIYRQQQPEPVQDDQETQDTQDDQQQQQSEPAAPAKPRVRTQRRKEQ